MLTADDVAGTRVDIRPEAHPDVVADGRDLPFADGYFAGALLDPPYSVEYARDLYGTDYPRPSHLLREAARVVRPCGRFAMLHYIVANPPPGCRIVDVRGVTQGCGYRIRALTVYERDQDSLKGLGR
jgi:SAM-dependent methyltransferase